MEETKIQNKISIVLLLLIVHNVITIILYLTRFWDNFGPYYPKAGFNFPFILEIIFSYIGIILFDIAYVCLRKKKENDTSVNKVMSGMVYFILIAAAVLAVFGLLLLFSYHD